MELILLLILAGLIGYLTARENILTHISNWFSERRNGKKTDISEAA